MIYHTPVRRAQGKYSLGAAKPQTDQTACEPIEVNLAAEAIFAFVVLV